MPFNGSGTFVSLPPPDFPALPGTVILASSFNANMNDLFTNGLTKCITRDGQSPPTANLPMASFRFTGIGAGIADTDSAQLGQVLAVRGTVGVVDWDTKITNGIFEGTAASLTGPAVNFPPTSSFGQLQVISQGANIIQLYITAHRAYSRMKLSGTWSSWAPQVDMSIPVAIASAATVNIGDADSTDINISGVTTITSFGPGQLGVFKRLTFAGAVTLTYNAASLILSNSVNYTTAAADTITFVSLGGSNWREVTRWTRLSPSIALDQLGTDGLVAKTSASTVAARTITGTANEITVTNGSGVAGNPVLSFPATMSFAGKTILNGGTVTTIDINGGTIDGTAIGGVGASTGVFTTLTATTGNLTSANIDGGTIDGTVIGGSSAAAGTFTSVAATTVNLDGGTIDGTVIGGVSAVAGSFTTANVSTLLNLTAGQIAFPATQVPSANVNTLDDYEEGTWTPTVTFNTPGTLSVTYTTQSGRYTKVGNMVTVTCYLQCATFTPGTASGNFLIQGIPFATVGSSGITAGGSLLGPPRLDAGFTQTAVVTVAAGSASLITQQAGSIKNATTMTATHWDGTFAPILSFTLSYMV